MPFCLKIQRKLQIEKPLAWTSQALEEQSLHPPSLLSCRQCCCVLSGHAPSGWAQRELRGSWCDQSHCTFKPTIVVALCHGNSSSVCITLCGGQVCNDAEGASCAPPPCAAPRPEEQQGFVWLVAVRTSSPQRCAAGTGAVTL